MNIVTTDMSGIVVSIVSADEIVAREIARHARTMSAN